MNEHRAQSLALAEQLAAILGTTPRAEYGRDLETSREDPQLYVNNDACYLTARVSGDHVTFDRFTVSDPNLARQIAQIIAKYGEVSP